MSEYVIRLPKGDVGGFASDPEQQQRGNASSPQLSNNLTVKNGVNLAVGYMAGKQVLSAGFKAVIGQIGDSQVETSFEQLGKVAGYIGVALYSPQAAAFRIISDIAVTSINAAVEMHQTNLENHIILETRGTYKKMGIGNYYG